jgi:hypothetical protein
MNGSLTAADHIAIADRYCHPLPVVLTHGDGA